METEMKAIRLVLDAIIDQLDVIAEDVYTPQICELISALEAAITISEEIE